MINSIKSLVKATQENFNILYFPNLLILIYYHILCNVFLLEISKVTIAIVKLYIKVLLSYCKILILL